MTHLLSTVLAASTVKSVGAVIAVLSVIAVVVYAVVNIRSGRDEVASEIELAANRKPILFQTYLRDTGEVINDLSMPLEIGGRHWGAVRVGFDSARLHGPGGRQAR